MHNPLDTIQPVSLADAINFIVENLEEDERLYVEMNGAENLHHSTGMVIRNVWIHPDGSLLTAHMVSNFEIGHADDMSDMILKGVTAKVRKERFDPHALALAAREFWIAKGHDPITGGEIG